MDRGRLDGLDGLRGVAAVGVAFLYHPLLEIVPSVVAHGPLPWLRAWGWMFVDLFFLISGFIFAHVYLGPAAGERGGMADFTVARLARLYPLHLLMLLVTAVLFAGDPANTWQAFIAHLLMMQAFVQPVAHTFDGPSWSISVEVVCYVLFALGLVRGERTLRWITGGAIVLALAHLLLLGRPGGPWVGDSVPRGLLGFFLGQVMWRCRVDLARLPTLLLVAVLAIGLAADMGSASSLLPVVLLAWPAALCLALRTPLLGQRVFVWLGDRSYALYLIHFPLLQAFIPALRATRDSWSALGIMLAYMSAALLMSDLVHRWFETPARRAIRAAWQRRPAIVGPDARAA